MQFSKAPKKYRFIKIGGSFSVLTDLNNKAYVWGANTNSELGVGDSQPRTQPTLVASLEDKLIT